MTLFFRTYALFQFSAREPAILFLRNRDHLLLLQFCPKCIDYKVNTRVGTMVTRSPGKPKLEWEFPWWRGGGPGPLYATTAVKRRKSTNCKADRGAAGTPGGLSSPALWSLCGGRLCCLGTIARGRILPALLHRRSRNELAAEHFAGSLN